MLNKKVNHNRIIFFITVFYFLLNSITVAQSVNDVIISRDAIQLKGKFYIAYGERIFPTVILLHGFPGNEKDVLGIGEKLSQAGINALTFNYSGTHKSEGKASHENNLSDINAAFNFLYESENISKFKIDTSFIYLGGWCHGGGLGLAYAVSHPEVHTVFAIAGSDQGAFFSEYASNPEMKKMIDEGFEEMSSKGIVRFDVGALPHEIAEKGIDKINPALDLKKNAAALAQKNILLIGGWDDVQTTIDQFLLPLYRALQKEKAPNVKIFAFQDDHYFKKTRDEIAKTIISWIKTSIEIKNKL
jgi:pimeloyl-ACP methyl ester carboxylesterase